MMPWEQEAGSWPMKAGQREGLELCRPGSGAGWPRPPCGRPGSRQSGVMKSTLDSMGSNPSSAT